MKKNKFRGFSDEIGDFVYGYLISRIEGVSDYFGEAKKDINGEYEEQEVYYIYDSISDEEYNFESGMKRVDYKSVGQFTGLLDANGKEIYEGDIVSDGYHEKYGRYEVKFEKIGWNFTSQDGGELEVIGNIYENPDLLTQAQLG